MGREIRAEQASLLCLLCCRGWVVSAMGCGEDPGPGRPVHFLVLGSSLTLTVLSSWTQVYLSVNFLLETLVIRKLWDD